MNARFIILLSASVFSRNRACVRLHLRPRPRRTIWIEHSHWSIFEFLARDFPQISYTEHIAHWTLSSFSLLSTLDIWTTACAQYSVSNNASKLHNRESVVKINPLYLINLTYLIMINRSVSMYVKILLLCFPCRLVYLWLFISQSTFASWWWPSGSSAIPSWNWLYCSSHRHPFNSMSVATCTCRMTYRHSL